MIIDKSVSKNFFGREPLIEALYKTASSAKDGGARSTLLSGKRGAGKTKFLANLYSLVFERQDVVVPFFYTIRRSFVSAEDFASDYLSSFILQRFEFQEKDTAVLSDIYSLEDLRKGAKEFGAQWVVDIIDDYMRVRKEGRESKTVLNAVSAPLRSYQITGMPVVVIIDDLHKIRQFLEFEGNDINPGFWMPFESSIRSMHVPHIFSGLPNEIEKLYFEDNPLGDHLEMIDLPCLNRADSIKLFITLCEMYGLKVELKSDDFIGTFGGNPLYITNFLQAAGHAGGVLSKDVFLQTYYNEIARGKTCRYWTFLLKRYIRSPDLRTLSLKFLYGLCGNNKDDTLQFEHDKFERISELLHDSGIVETGFSRTVLADEMLRDIIKGLYQREIENVSPSGEREPIVKKEGEIAQESTKEITTESGKEGGKASFVITIPADTKAGLVAIKSFEQIAINYSIPLKVIEKLQLAMADLFSNVLAGDAHAESFQFQVKSIENSFSVEITTPQKGLVLTEQDSIRIGAYVDDLKLDGNGNGTVITLVKGIGEIAAPPAGD